MKRMKIPEYINDSFVWNSTIKADNFHSNETSKNLLSSMHCNESSFQITLL